tara:strand:+ start:364 stop:1551 length:1188 start_codon:yes stop_codon:yes gene_type:complete
MSTCKNCLYKNTHPFGLFIKDGICSGCFTHEEKYEINWIDRVELLKNKITKIVRKNRSHYDCVIPYSGDAEDYHVVNIVLGLGLNPLMVSINDYFLNDIGWHNSHNLITHFDLDSYNFNPEISAYKELVRTSMRKHTHALWPSLALKSAFPVHVAKQKKIPLIIYGQNQSIEQVGKFSHLEEVESSSWSRVEHDLFGYEINDLLGSGGHVVSTDNPYYSYPELSKLGAGKLVGLYLSNYFLWDPLYQNSQVLEHGFIPQKQNATFDPYERAGSSIYYNFHDLSKKIRCGYRKINDHVAREIRHSRLNTQEGKKIISHYDSNPVYIKDFFHWLEVSDSGYEWFISHKLHSVKHLISDTPVKVPKSSHLLPRKLNKNISSGKTPKKSFETFMKGIRL